MQMPSRWSGKKGRKKSKCCGDFYAVGLSQGQNPDFQYKRCINSARLRRPNDHQIKKQNCKSAKRMREGLKIGNREFSP